VERRIERRESDEVKHEEQDYEENENNVGGEP
jgi:hypothetical protein